MSKRDTEKLLKVFYRIPWASGRWVPTHLMLAILSAISLYGIAGTIWHIGYADGNEFTREAIEWGRMLFGFLPLDIAFTIIGVLGFLIAPRTRESRKQSGFSHDTVVRSCKGHMGKRITRNMDKISIMRRKEEIYKRYASIYKLFDRVFYIEDDQCEREKYDVMGKQLGAMYDMLSYHKRSLDFSSSNVIEKVLLDDELFESELKKLDNIKDEIDAITDLWSSAACLNGVRVLLCQGNVAHGAEDDLHRLGGKFAMDSRMEAYYTKHIPLQDLKF